jgi:hypothetical protein
MWPRRRLAAWGEARSVEATATTRPPINRQASLDVADTPGQGGGGGGGLAGLAKPKPLIRINSDSDLHIQQISQEEERVLETLDEIQLLHNMAKAPKLIGNGNLAKNSSGKLASAVSAVSNASNASADRKKLLLVKQKSLNRTLSTSALRIKKKRPGFWQT